MDLQEPTTEDLHNTLQTQDERRVDDVVSGRSGVDDHGVRFTDCRSQLLDGPGASGPNQVFLGGERLEPRI
jgi:hypothetical protein